MPAGRTSLGAHATDDACRKRGHVGAIDRGVSVEIGEINIAFAVHVDVSGWIEQGHTSQSSSQAAWGGVPNFHPSDNRPLGRAVTRRLDATSQPGPPWLVLDAEPYPPRANILAKRPKQGLARG